MEGEGERLVIRYDAEVLGLQQVSELSHGLIYCQELPEVTSVLLLCRAQLLGKKARLPDVFNALLQDGIYGGG
jgi:hypothetical protein